MDESINLSLIVMRKNVLSFELIYVTLILGQGFFIPKGTWVLLHFYAMSRKEEDWKDAHLFRPERFLDEQGAFQKNENFLVFSTGISVVTSTSIFCLTNNTECL